MTKFEDLLDAHICLIDSLGCARKGAVVADVTAEVCQGYEYLLGIGNDVAMGTVAQGPGLTSKSCGICSRSQR